MNDSYCPAPFASSLPAGLASRLKHDAGGLVAAVVQQYDTREVLMVGWMDDEALHRTLTEGRVTFWSRSRREYWRKGDTSGHCQYVKAVHLDCDGDAIVMLIDQNGGIACHTGRESCFYKVWKDGAWQTVDAVLKDEKAIYGHTHP